MWARWSEVASQPTPSPLPSASTAVVSPSSVPPTPTPEPSKPLKKPWSVYWQNLKPGLCVMFPDEDEAFDVTVTDCRADHHGEVMLRTTLPGDRTWPGDDAIDAAATALCEKAFPRYVGLPFDESRLEVDFIITDRDGWEDGDRRLICLVYDPEGETTAVVLKGSKL